jgi:hypothetical protein
VGVNIILTPPCVFHYWFSIQNIQGGIRMALTATPTQVIVAATINRVVTAARL